MLTDRVVIIRLILALLLGGLVGLEREAHGRAAGFRTHILVCLGSTLIMLTSLYIFECYKTQVALDPSRIAAGVVTGVGFLGAGTIMRYGASVVGLTTAASLWVVAGIGLALGAGFYIAAYTTALLSLICLFIFNRLEHGWLKNK